MIYLMKESIRVSGMYLMLLNRYQAHHYRFRVYLGHCAIRIKSIFYRFEITHCETLHYILVHDLNCIHFVTDKKQSVSFLLV